MTEMILPRNRALYLFCHVQPDHRAELPVARVMRWLCGVVVGPVLAAPGSTRSSSTGGTFTTRAGGALLIMIDFRPGAV